MEINIKFNNIYQEMFSKFMIFDFDPTFELKFQLKENEKNGFALRLNEFGDSCSIYIYNNGKITSYKFQSNASTILEYFKDLKNSELLPERDYFFVLAKNYTIFYNILLQCIENYQNCTVEKIRQRYVKTKKTENQKKFKDQKLLYKFKKDIKKTQRQSKCII
jgi:hypothetical protein